MPERPTEAERIQQRINTAIAVAQNPISYLERAKGVPGVNQFAVLLELRQILKEHLHTNPGLEINDVNPDFYQFFQANTNHVTFYEAALRLLQQANYSREEVGQLVAHLLRQEDAPGNEQMIEAVVGLVNQALANVYPPVGKPLN